MVAGASEDAARGKMRQAIIIIIMLECWTAAAPLPFGTSGARGEKYNFVGAGCLWAHSDNDGQAPSQIVCWGASTSVLRILL
jgi:hypothetical protein